MKCASPCIHAAYGSMLKKQADEGRFYLRQRFLVEPDSSRHSLNAATDATSSCACCFRLAAAAALSSTSAAFCCVA